jgi:hypothetical protein
MRAFLEQEQVNWTIIKYEALCFFIPRVLVSMPIKTQRERGTASVIFCSSCPTSYTDMSSGGYFLNTTLSTGYFKLWVANKTKS